MSDFIRVGRWLLNLRYVRAVETDPRGSVIIHVEGGSAQPLTAEQGRDLLALLEAETAAEEQAAAPEAAKKSPAKKDK